MLGRPADKKLMKVQTKPVTPFVRVMWAGFLAAAMRLLKNSGASPNERYRVSTMQTISARVCTTERRPAIHPESVRTWGATKAEVHLKIQAEMQAFVRTRSPDGRRALVALCIGPWRTLISQVGSFEAHERGALVVPDKTNVAAFQRHFEVARWGRFSARCAVPRRTPHPLRDGWWQ